MKFTDDDDNDDDDFDFECGLDFLKLSNKLRAHTRESFSKATGRL